MVLMYWDIGRMILDRQEHAGWGAKVVDRLAAAWPERAIVQEPLARIPWYHHIALLEKLADPVERLWYAQAASAHGWSHNIASPNRTRTVELGTHGS